MEIDWEQLKVATHSKSVRTMLEKLYVKEGLSIFQISKKLGPSYNAIREQLILQGISLRKRGGALVTGEIWGKLRALTDERLFGERASSLAAEFDICTQAVYRERKRRKEKMIVEVSDGVGGGEQDSKTTGEVGDNGAGSSEEVGSDVVGVQSELGEGGKGDHSHSNRPKSHRPRPRHPSKTPV